MRPGVSMVPVKGSGNGEVWVQGRRVGSVTDQGIDVVFVSGEPRRVEVADDSGGQNEVAIVEMVVVVIGIAKVYTSIACNVGR